MGKIALILAATSIGLGLASLHLVKQLRDSDAAVTELKAQVASLEALAAARPALAPPAATFMVAPARPAGNVIAAPVKDTSKTVTVMASSTSPSTLPPREERIRMMREHRDQQRQLMQDPDYREAMRLQSRSNFARQYPGVIQELGLDSQQADEFFSMLADQQMRTTEHMSPLWETDIGDTPDPTVMQERHRKLQQLAAEMQRKNEAELAARFGQDKLQAWQEYQSTVGMRYQLEHMRSTLAAQGLTLNEDVSKPMLKAMAAAQKAEADEYSAAVSRGAAPTGTRLLANVALEGQNMARHIEDSRKRNQRMLDAISPYLTFEQRAAIEKEQEAQVKMQEAQQRIMRARGGNKANGSVYLEGSAQLIPVQ